MIFSPTAVDGVLVVHPERIRDDRGSFARTFSVTEFDAQGLTTSVDQCSVSINLKAGTLRGMHYQAEPHGEFKLVRCTRGAIYDVAGDLRPQSPTYLRWAATELTPQNGHALAIPEGCAHGFQTLVDDSEVLYQISAAYAPDAGRGVRWDDPRFGIEWPPAPLYGRTLSERDANYADYLG
jgi:dTDP-4-dehydrorhamnose 3,5-epimerase